MKTLFDETHLGQMTLKNRFIRAAIGEKTSDGHVNETILSLYKALALGGAGALITGFTLVDENEKNFPLLAFYNDAFREGHKALTDLVHENHAHIILQLVYVGSYVRGDTAGMSVLAPSAVENLNTKVLPQEISVRQIKRIQERFSEAALRAKNAGYDGVEIHAAHGFFLSQFMTPYYNRRTDLYGASAQNRARMALETYAAVREAVGAEFPILIKINVNDGFEGEVRFEDVLYLCKALTEMKIDAIEISGAFRSFPQNATAFFKKEAAQIAAENETKIIMTGGNRDFEEMTAILRHTGIEYFGLARPLITEPDLINRFKALYT
ncbi:MAG: NADH:flavin oxidoreductase [Oscillospiraceae bacterium]|jgi:2,4-dienoyl-CoA reductase-like NADH-dependent reductase (Old Yellow Enzyme family)|nr:NADH:flavin oxidoreductase [Oscillospiraceae bacterium]